MLSAYLMRIRSRACTDGISLTDGEADLLIFLPFGSLPERRIGSEQRSLMGDRVASALLVRVGAG